MSSSLEDRIRLLTDQAIAAKTQGELDSILSELKARDQRSHTLCAGYCGRDSSRGVRDGQQNGSLACVDSLSVFQHQTRRAYLVCEKAVSWQPFAPNNNGS
jgi:hypothetical protein